MSADILLRRLETELTRVRFRFRDEKGLHDGIAVVLGQIGVGFTREHIASKEDRFDFLLDGGVVIEAKINGGLSDAATQVKRYMQLELVTGVALVSTKRWPPMVSHLNGKPIVGIHVQRIAF